MPSTWSSTSVTKAAAIAKSSAARNHALPVVDALVATALRGRTSVILATPCAIEASSPRASMVAPEHRSGVPRKQEGAVLTFVFMLNRIGARLHILTPDRRECKDRQLCSLAFARAPEAPGEPATISLREIFRAQRKHARREATRRQ